MSDSNEKSCWSCTFQELGNETFLGVCTWFEKKGKGKNKDIPVDVVDKGCQHWKESGSRDGK